MASRFRSISRPAISMLKSSIPKSSTTKSIPSSFLLPRSSPTISRSFAQLGCVQSLLPLHSAVSSARLTSCLGIDSKGSRSLSQELSGSIHMAFLAASTSLLAAWQRFSKRR